MASYDHDWCGIGHPNHPANQPEPKTILMVCYGCDDLVPSNEIVEDGDTNWCTSCWAEVQEEIKKTKAPVTERSRSAGVIQ